MQLINVFTALALLTSTYAAIIEPQAGAEWIAGKEGSITWETAKFGAKVDIALVPAGATDMSVTMVDIAKATENTGSMQWILPPTMAVGACSIIISNSQAGSTASTTTSTSSTSGVTIIIIEGSRVCFWRSIDNAARLTRSRQVTADQVRMAQLALYRQ